MTAARVDLGATVLQVHVDEQLFEIPVGWATLAASIGGDPPDPADLTNAIGLVVDHLDDLARVLPAVRHCSTVRIGGEGVTVLADVEAGHTVHDGAVLGRRAAEEIFRALATETRLERVRNPALPARWVHDVLAVACAIVALMRTLDLDAVEVARG